MDVDVLRRKLACALNASGADAACGIPDFEMAEALTSIVLSWRTAMTMAVRQGYAPGHGDDRVGRVIELGEEIEQGERSSE